MGEVAGREGIGRIKHIFPTVSPRAVVCSDGVCGNMCWAYTTSTQCAHALLGFRGVERHPQIIVCQWVHVLAPNKAQRLAACRSRRGVRWLAGWSAQLHGSDNACAKIGRSVTAACVRTAVVSLQVSQSSCRSCSSAAEVPRITSATWESHTGRPQGRGPRRSCPRVSGCPGACGAPSLSLTPPATVSRQHRMPRRPGDRLLIGPRDAVYRGFVKGLANDLHGQRQAGGGKLRRHGQCWTAGQIKRRAPGADRYTRSALRPRRDRPGSCWRR
jgi:hypothetical protein